jgi:hypothetical protein
MSEDQKNYNRGCAERVEAVIAGENLIEQSDDENIIQLFDDEPGGLRLHGVFSIIDWKPQIGREHVCDRLDTVEEREDGSVVVFLPMMHMDGYTFGSGWWIEMEGDGVRTTACNHCGQKLEFPTRR